MCPLRLLKKKLLKSVKKRVFKENFLCVHIASWESRHDELWLDKLKPSRSNSLIDGHLSLHLPLHHHRHLFKAFLFHHTPHTQSYTRAANFYIHQRIFFLFFITRKNNKKKNKKLKKKKINGKFSFFGKFTMGWFMSRHLSLTLCCLWLKLENLFNLARGISSKKWETKFFFRASKFILHGRLSACSLSPSFHHFLCMEWNYKIKIIDSTRRAEGGGEEFGMWEEKKFLLKVL